MPRRFKQPHFIEEKATIDDRAKAAARWDELHRKYHVSFLFVLALLTVNATLSHFTGEEQTEDFSFNFYGNIVVLAGLLILHWIAKIKSTEVIASLTDYRLTKQQATKITNVHERALSETNKLTVVVHLFGLRYAYANRQNPIIASLYIVLGVISFLIYVHLREKSNITFEQGFEKLKDLIDAIEGGRIKISSSHPVYTITFESRPYALSADFFARAFAECCVELAIGSSVFTDNRRVLLCQDPNMILDQAKKELFINLLNYKLEELQKIQITLQNLAKVLPFRQRYTMGYHYLGRGEEAFCFRFKNKIPVCSWQNFYPNYDLSFFDYTEFEIILRADKFKELLGKDCQQIEKIICLTSRHSSPVAHRKLFSKSSQEEKLSPVEENAHTSSSFFAWMSAEKPKTRPKYVIRPQGDLTEPESKETTIDFGKWGVWDGTQLSEKTLTLTTPRFAGKATVPSHGEIRLFFAISPGLEVFFSGNKPLTAFLKSPRIANDSCTDQGITLQSFKLDGDNNKIYHSKIRVGRNKIRPASTQMWDIRLHDNEMIRFIVFDTTVDHKKKILPNKQKNIQPLNHADFLDRYTNPSSKLTRRR
ncbi:hypothetical protein [Coxiella burnetii]|uniref:hypothetical protein n=1 Tax=Coxiella burnetii TaxID=777 RepID=UPI00051F177D|nr:hypothetical protein [Coxiella burnetii]AIT63409.1 putative cytosolic protein [Coxiella burnetii str. Namibia]